MSTKIELLEDALDLADAFREDGGTYQVGNTLSFPVSSRDWLDWMLGKKPKRVSQILNYENGPLRMTIEQIVSRKAREEGRVVQISVDIRYAWHCLTSQRITTIEQLEEALNDFYGTGEEIDATAVTN